MSQTRRVEKLLQPATRQKALQAARTFQHRVLSSTGPVDCYGFASEAVQDIFTNLSQPEIDVLVTVVLSDTLRATEEELHKIKMNQAQLELREDIRAVERLAAKGRKSRANSQDSTIGAFPAKPQTTQIRPLGITYPNMPDVTYDVTYDLSDGKGVTIGGLKSLLDDLKGKLDGMNEMSEMTSLRLQMTMDRRSKFISTLSQIMKKISTTQDILIQNIK